VYQSKYPPRKSRREKFTNDVQGWLGWVHHGRI
jgi:hypothetical protein